jgi:DtxR family transcriptional regulator, Mn-dependent transcriptional regulator
MADKDVKITEEVVDEMLESLWLLEERGIAAAGNRPKLCAIAVDEGAAENPAEADALVEQIAAQGYFATEGSSVEFKGTGRDRARRIIRRKRLAEKLLAEVLAVESGEIRSTACRFEHILSPEVTNSVCSFLGHPPTCPHGKPIPQGECCKKLSHHVKPLVMPMSDLEPGSRGRIVFIAPKDHSRMDRLSSLGIVPGTEVQLHQKRPAFVIRIGETELALEMEIAGEIYVKELR